MKCDLLHLIYFEMGCDILNFVKPFLKGKILQTGKGGELDFDHHFAVLTNFLKR